MYSIENAAKTAATLLNRRGNRLRLTLCGIGLILALLLPWITGWHASVLIFGDYSISDQAPQTWIAYAIQIGLGTLLTALVTAPCVGAFYTFAGDLVSETLTGAPTSQKKERYTYGNLFACGMFALLRPTLLWALPSITNLLYTGNSRLLQYLFYAAALAIGLLIMYLSRSWFSIPALMTVGQEPYDAIVTSKAMRRANKGLYVAYWKRFLPHVPLCFLTVGVSLILYTLPLMITTYFILVKERLDEQGKEDIIHE